MSLLLDIARASAGVNVVLLVALAYVWASNYRQIRSKQTLGSLVFALFLVAENGLALYYYFSGLALPAAAVQAMAFLQVLEMGGIAFLTWVTYR